MNPEDLGTGHGHPQSLACLGLTCSQLSRQGQGPAQLPQEARLES